MATLAAALAALVTLGGLVAGVVYYLRRNAETSVDLSQRDAALQVESDHVAAMEAAAETARSKAAQEFDAQARAVTDAQSAANLLRARFPGRGNPAPHL